MKMASFEDRFPNRKKWLVGMVIFLVFSSGFPTSAFVFKTGECRSIAETVKNFDIRKFLGTWYVIQSSNTAARCHTISFKESSGSFAFIVNKQIYSLLAAGIVHNLHYEAQVFPNPENAASMVVRMPSSLYSDISYEVIGTDYSSWAVMWACKNQMFGHLESGLVLSRTNTLPIESLTLIRQDLMSLGVTALSTVQQKDCNPKLGGGFFTLELASGTTSVSVDWESLIPNSQLPSAITDGCFVQEGQYFYFREVCPSASTGTDTGGNNSTGEYYYYYYDDPEQEALEGGTDESGDSGDNGIIIDDGTEGDYYYYYYEDGASGDYYDAEGLDGSGEEYYEYSSSGDEPDTEYTDEYDYYYDDYSGDQYYDDEYYDGEYYSDEYYDDEYGTAELQMATVERDLEDVNGSHSIRDYLEVKDGISEALPEMAARNWSLLFNTVAGDLGEINWSVKDGMIPNNIIPEKDGVNELSLEKDETGILIRNNDSLGINEWRLLRTKRDSKSKELNKSVEKVSKKIGESSSLANKNSKDELLKISKDNKDKKDMEGNLKSISKKDRKNISDKKPGQNKETKGKSKKKKKMRKKKRRKGKKKKRRRNKNKGRKERRRRRKRKRKNRKRGKNKGKKNPLIAKLIMMSGRLQKFLMTHNIGIRKLPVTLRLKDLYSYFRNKREKRRLRRLVKRAKGIWGSKVKRKVKKKGKKHMKIFKNKSTWKKGKKGGKKRRNKGKSKVKGRRRKGKGNKKDKGKIVNKGNGDKIGKIRKKSNKDKDKKSADINVGKLMKNGNMEITGSKGNKNGGILKIKKLKKRKKKRGKGKPSGDKRRKKKLRRKERKKMRKKMKKRMRKKLKKKMKGRRKDGKRGKKRKGNKKKPKNNKKNKKRNKRKRKKKNRNNRKGKQNKKKQLERKLNKKEKKNKKKKIDGINDRTKNKDNDDADKEMKQLLKSLGL